MSDLASDAVRPRHSGRALPRLVTVPYPAGTGPAIDRLLATVARRLQSRGVRVAGVIQTTDGDGEHRCADMILEDLVSGRRAGISQALGRDARGCRLDPAALDTVAAAVEQSVRDGAELLILNRFGEREAAGQGLVGAMVAAVERQVPILAGLNARYREAWDGFVAGAAGTLPADAAAILAWCDGVLAQPEPRVTE